jgi:hypothetical protein
LRNAVSHLRVAAKLDELWQGLKIPHEEPARGTKRAASPTKSALSSPASLSSQKNEHYLPPMDDYHHKQLFYNSDQEYCEDDEYLSDCNAFDD